MTSVAIEDQIIELGPWCHEIQVTPDVSTRVWLDAASGESDLPFIDPHKVVTGRVLQRLFPAGLEGRSVLDCGCNAGGYLFMAAEYGAGNCVGFDVREHWIRQAEFVLSQRSDLARITFAVSDVYDLPTLNLEPFDLAFFNGIFYHLPDPLSGMRLVAELTRELLILDTATRSGVADGFLAVENESTDALLSGIYGLNWLPTGPDVLRRILQWLGFEEWHVAEWRKETRPGVGRLVMFASRRAGLLAKLRS